MGKIKEGTEVGPEGGGGLKEETNGKEKVIETHVYALIVINQWKSYKR